MRDNSYFYAFILVFIAGFLWSLGAVVVLHMIDGHSYVFNYLFYRGISIAIILVCYLIIREGLDFYKNFKKDKKSLYKWTTMRTSMKRWGEPEEIADLVCFLLSNKSSCITGESINIDGGWTSS